LTAWEEDGAFESTLRDRLQREQRANSRAEGVEEEWSEDGMAGAFVAVGSGASEQWAAAGVPMEGTWQGRKGKWQRRGSIGPARHEREGEKCRRTWRGHERRAGGYI
jgi:hypothetical protein